MRFLTGRVRDSRALKDIGSNGNLTHTLHAYSYQCRNIHAVGACRLTSHALDDLFWASSAMIA